MFGPDHVRTLDCRHDLALMHFRRRDIAKAQCLLEPVYRKMVEILGSTSRATQSVANNLASCANMQQQWDYAEKILQAIPELTKAAAEPLEIDITGFHANTLHALSILAAILAARGEDQRSEILHQRVIDGFTVLEGPKAHRIYESAINKGQALRDQHKYGLARKHYQEWLKRSDQHLGPESKHSREIRKRMADLDSKEKKWRETAQIMKVPVVQALPFGQGRTMTRFVAIAILISVVFSFGATYFRK